MEISIELVSRLVREQFPQWASLPIRPVAQSGHDNRTFHLGSDMTVRLPSGKDYVPQIEKEAKWLPFLAKGLTLPISCPVVMGLPAEGYPYPWSVNRYIPGDTLCRENIFDMECFAGELAHFLKQLQGLDTHHAPVAGAHNFYRGASPAVYDAETQRALDKQKDVLPTETLRAIWARSIATTWDLAPVWIHGDIAPGNLLVRDGHLCGVIDFGIMGIGDPACDYAMAWTFFSGQSRARFLQGLDPNTVDRARGWALWKALITLDDPISAVSCNASHTLHAILEEANHPAQEEIAR